MLVAQPDGDAPDPYATQPIEVCGERFIADPSGALYWPAQQALIVADLHLEKGSAWARRGRMLPPYDTRVTLLKLSAAVDRYRPGAVVALGDSLHDQDAGQRIGRADLRILRWLQNGRDWMWLTGNHDPQIDQRLGGTCRAEVQIGRLRLRHMPRQGRAIDEIAGHLHPAARLSTAAGMLRRPCFVGNGLRLVLPAFGAFTGGLNVLDGAIARLFSEAGFAVWMLGRTGLYPVATQRLLAD